MTVWFDSLTSTTVLGPSPIGLCRIMCSSQSLKNVGWVNRLSEAWLTGPSLESCESPELSMEVGSGGSLIPKKGEWKLVR